MIRIACLGSDPTIAFAADELGRYLEIATGVRPSVEHVQSLSGDALNLGLISDFAELRMPAVPCTELDDAIEIGTDGPSGHIAGNNPRSVLLAAYRYLTELGCRWVRPGTDGEVIPKIVDLSSIKVSETPSYRHRGLCIEGAVSLEHVRDTIDWLPKVGFNAYFTQFRESYTFFERWYSHDGNPTLEGRKISVDEAREFVSILAKDIEKRGLLYHAVGHGWTCEPFGISGLAWVPSEEPVPQESVKYLAEVNGERKLFGGIALNTNLCYGNPEARQIMVKAVADYAEEHPEVDLLHLWLADGGNNHCECELCRDTLPSDFYVQILNGVDEALSAKGLNTRVVFLIYMDLLWAPVKEKIQNPDRFVLMFAPITRTFSRPFIASDEPVTLPEFKRNKLEYVKSIEANVAFLRMWQEKSNVDSFDFDYHLMWAHYDDLGYMQIAKLLHDDIRNLRDINLNGLISCQVQRAFFPSGLPMMVMGRTLWDSSLSFESIATDYFQSAFGPDGELCRKYLEAMSDLFDSEYLRGKTRVDAEAAGKFARVKGVIEEFAPVIDRNRGSKSECVRTSWEYIGHHAHLCALFGEMFKNIASGDDESARPFWEQARDYVRENEMRVHKVLDLYIFQRTMGRMLADQE